MLNFVWDPGWTDLSHFPCRAGIEYPPGTAIPFFFWCLSSGYSCSICSYTHARTTLHTHTTLTPHVYKQTYNYTQIWRPRPSGNHRKPPRLRRQRARCSPFVAPRGRGKHLESIQAETKQQGTTVPGGKITSSSALEPWPAASTPGGLATRATARSPSSGD